MMDDVSRRDLLRIIGSSMVLTTRGVGRALAGPGAARPSGGGGGEVAERRPELSAEVLHAAQFPDAAQAGGSDYSRR